MHSTYWQGQSTSYMLDCIMLLKQDEITTHKDGAVIFIKKREWFWQWYATRRAIILGP